MTTNSNCDMPWGVYLDWLEDQGWDVSELRAYGNEEEIQAVVSNYWSRNGYGNGLGYGYVYGLGYGLGYGKGNEYMYGNGYGNGYGSGERYRNT